VKRSHHQAQAEEDTSEEEPSSSEVEEEEQYFGTAVPVNRNILVLAEGSFQISEAAMKKEGAWEGRLLLQRPEGGKQPELTFKALFIPSVVECS